MQWIVEKERKQHNELWLKRNEQRSELWLKELYISI